MRPMPRNPHRLLAPRREANSPSRFSTCPPRMTGSPGRRLRSTTTTRPASSSIRGSFWRRSSSRPDGRSPTSGGSNSSAGGAFYIISDLPAAMLLEVADAVRTRGVSGLQRRRNRRLAQRGRLPRQRLPYGAHPLHARRRARPVSRLEAVAQLVPDLGLARDGQAVGRRIATVGQALRRQNRRGAGCSRTEAARARPTAAMC